MRIRVLPAMAQLEDETVQEFALRVQKVMAQALSVNATPYTSADKVEHIKRHAKTLESWHRSGITVCALVALKFS